MRVPTPAMSDSELAETLKWVVMIASPLLNRVANTDPLDLKNRDYTQESSSAWNKALNRVAGIVQSQALPGTPLWEEKTVQERCAWWSSRIGVIGSLIAAVPGFFGVLSARFPLRDACGFATQAVALCAIAREKGVTDRPTLVRLLGTVLCQRTLSSTDASSALAALPPQKSPSRSFRGRSTKIAGGIWRITRILWSITSELQKRPTGARIFSFLSAVPVLGVLGSFLSERGGVTQAVTSGDSWLTQQLSLPSSQKQQQKSWLGKMLGRR